MKRIRSYSVARMVASLALLALTLPSYSSAALAENKPSPGLVEFAKTLSGVQDYKALVSVHETSDDGKDVQDRTYRYKWKRPSMAQIDVLAGPGKGGGAVWTGGEQVRGHQGGILSGIKMSIDIHDKRAVSLRGNTIAAASFEYMIKHFLTTTGALAESPGPTIDGIATTTITLAVADPKSDGNVTREVLYLGTAKHLPVRRDAFVGTQLVGSETFKDVQTNTGIKTEDFNA